MNTRNLVKIIGIIGIILAVTIPVMAFGGVFDEVTVTETCVVIDKYDTKYTLVEPMASGKTMILMPITHHDYYLNTSKGVIPVTSRDYEYYNVSDVLNISVNSDGKIREILN